MNFELKIKKNKLIVQNERGISLVELSIGLPILILLAVGIVSFSLALRDKKTMSGAAREGARIAARYSLESQTPYCANPNTAPAETTDCVSYPTLECWSKKTSKDYLQKAGLDPNGVRVKSKVFDSTQNGLTLRMVQVELEEKANRPCILCLNKMFQKPLQAKAVFALQGKCL